MLLDAEDETVRMRTVVARAETEFIRGYALGRFGEHETALIDHFQREREAFRTMFQQSAMKKLRVEAERSIDQRTTCAITMKQFHSQRAASLVCF